MKGWAKISIAVMGAAVLAAAAYVLTREPRNDREWSDEFARTASATAEQNGLIVLDNVRDFTYGDGKVRSRNWLMRVPLKPGEVSRVWYVEEPFGSSKAVAHVFLTFEFRDGSAYSLSAEARTQHNEPFSIPRGMLNQYELTYSWGTERDFLTRRLVYLHHPVYMYPLKLSPKQAKGVFLAMVAHTNALSARPRFYNTLTDNCASSLARTIDRYAPGAVPFDIAWILPGYSDAFLARVGYLAVAKPFAAQRAKYRLSAERPAIATHAGDDAVSFSTFLRGFLPKPAQ
jgi:hypothetical protein